MFNALLYKYSINKIVKKIYRCIIKRCWVFGNIHIIYFGRPVSSVLMFVKEAIYRPKEVECQSVAAALGSLKAIKSNEKSRKT